jgi:hypothetical protein
MDAISIKDLAWIRSKSEPRRLTPAAKWQPGDPGLGGQTGRRFERSARLSLSLPPFLQESRLDKTARARPDHLVIALPDWIFIVKIHGG